ncbi:MAG: N-acetylmuramoyl-L-alanine amidase [Pseudomonadota bacterium]
MALEFRERRSSNYDQRSRAIDLVVLHYTGMQDAETALARLTDPEPKAGRYPGPWQAHDTDPNAPLARVSSHYVLDEAGVVYRVVDEAQRAWHAGASNWEGEGDVNARAIGIEIVNGGHDFGLPDFPDVQIEALIVLLRDILARNKLAPSRVVAHSDIAPDRKLDPGEKFPWKRLAEAGVAIWPGAGGKPPTGDPVLFAQERLAALGYGVTASGVVDAQTKAALSAFQRRFRQGRVDGVADEETLALLAALSN